MQVSLMHYIYPSLYIELGDNIVYISIKRQMIKQFIFSIYFILCECN